MKFKKKSFVMVGIIQLNYVTQAALTTRFDNLHVKVEHLETKKNEAKILKQEEEITKLKTRLIPNAVLMFLMMQNATFIQPTTIR